MRRRISQQMVRQPLLERPPLVGIRPIPMRQTPAPAYRFDGFDIDPSRASFVKDGAEQRAQAEDVFPPPISVGTSRSGDLEGRILLGAVDERGRHR